MTQIVETIPAHLSDQAEAARAWFSAREGAAFKLTGIVNPDDAAVSKDQSSSCELQLIFCGARDGQDVCLRERFHVSQANRDFDAAPMLETVTLMIRGEEDRALGVELTRGTDELVSDLTLRYLPNVSHWVQQEAPGRVNEIVLAWMQGEPVPGNTRPGGSDGATE